MDTQDEETKPDPSRRRKVILRPRSRVDYPRRDPAHREEYAAEVSPPLVRQPGTGGSKEPEVRQSEGEHNDSATMGYIALGFGIVSLFIWSIIAGPVAVVLGYSAYSRGQKTAGAWAMGLGIVSTLSYFVMIPFAR
ncbi:MULTISPECIES: hypothetical protein [unclassified Paenibacillus]|uniref:hypothetical protein n=1 Tax=unclassified Paenibacillus TaxID=185978 RepID=UPI0024075ADE|nr:MULTISPECIES: hypothetical protein [unclassified Paenibacillus]MDF9843248.1 hypothetical protein [Paenibacillus sp. PastF-2]MDF9849836.1 hypothetical protein [Paenibacillus sp. PastM-2]MDF9856543.1 hypothetical protein [Paenibacillus sp. PastF-1]MDH6481813.1 hypothetical protein [Paenibacillus sp. PastH-2]MDH6509098.1 hypothetical protein [Paenibacillus sp. PastM-3]